MIVDSPNNPTGQVYEADILLSLGRLLAEHSARHGRPVYLVADEPYRRIVYDGREVPRVFAAYPDTLLATSFPRTSPSLGSAWGIPRCGSQAAGRRDLVGGLVLANPHPGFR